jgi:hypothetical protein
VHPVPVILVRGAAGETNLIVSAVVVESRPGKTVRATSSEDPLQKAHFAHSSVGESAVASSWRSRRTAIRVSARLDVLRGVLPSVRAKVCLVDVACKLI